STPTTTTTPPPTPTATPTATLTITPRSTLRPGRMQRRGYDPPRRRARDLGSVGCQPARLGSLPRWENGNYPAAYSEDVVGRAAGNYRLAACASLQFRSARGRF